MAYRRHNAFVREMAPRDKVLFYSLADGWEPLCRFLDVKIPLTPFPHKNKAASLIKEFQQTNPVFKKMQREVVTSLACLVALSLFAGYKTVKASATSSLDIGWLNPMNLISRLKF